MVELFSAGSFRMHEIHLRRPWNRFSGLDLQPVVVDVPDVSPRTGSSKAAGDRVSYQRGFNSPTGLSGTDMICLCISEWLGKLESVRVNDTLFSHAVAPLVVDLSKILLGFNQIEIILTSDSAVMPRLTGKVVLRI
jgi:hypothetical protein